MFFIAIPYIAVILYQVKTTIIKEKAGKLNVETALLLEFAEDHTTLLKIACSCTVWLQFRMDAYRYYFSSVDIRIGTEDVEALTAMLKRGISQVSSVDNIIAGLDIWRHKSTYGINGRESCCSSCSE